MELNVLIENINKAKAVHEAICLLKKEEQHALAIGNTNKVFETAVKINELADEAAALESGRLHITAAIAIELGMEKQDPTLSELLAALPVYNRIELESAGKALLDTVTVLQQQNQASAQMLERSMNTLSAEIAKLAQTGESGVYSADGKRKSPPPMRAGLNVRV